MRTVMILRGAPGSGKSTFARELLAQEPKRWVCVNRDDLRAMFGTKYSVDSEVYIRNVQDSLIRSACENGYDVIVDNTHLIPNTLKNLHFLAESIGDVTVIEKAFNTPIDQCIERDAKREGTARVGKKVINDMAHAAGLDKDRVLKDKTVVYPAVTNTAPVVQDESLPRAIICDLDGTLAIKGDRSPYDASQCDILDSPNPAVINCITAMYMQGVKLIFMSGREDKDDAPTRCFIEKHVQLPFIHSFIGKMIVPLKYELHMRRTGDTRKDMIVKRELFDAHVAGKYNVLFCLDDRNQVVNGWRSMGLACFQVAPGAF